MKKQIAAWLAALCAATNIALAAGDLEEGFRTPPEKAKPRVYWWWLNNLVSMEGTTRDLQEFKAKGIGGVLLFNAGGSAGPMPSGPDFMSPQWRELLKHAVREAGRLGLEASLNLCSGWDAGGPWINDESASHRYVQAELTLKGPQPFSGKLPQPPGSVTGYHDVAVQAFQQPAGPEKRRLQQPRVTASSSQQDYPAAKAVDGDNATMWVSNGWNDGDAPTPERPEWLRLEHTQSIQTETLWITPRSPYGPRMIEVQTSQDGKKFTTIKSHTLKQDGEQTVPLPPTRDRSASASMPPASPNAGTRCTTKFPPSPAAGSMRTPWRWM